MRATFDPIVNPLEGRYVLDVGHPRHGAYGLLHGEGLQTLDEPRQPGVRVVEPLPADQAPDHVQARHVEQAGNGDDAAGGGLGKEIGVIIITGCTSNCVICLGEMNSDSIGSRTLYVHIPYVYVFENNMQLYY